MNFSMKALIGLIVALLGFVLGPDGAAMFGPGVQTIATIVGTAIAAVSPQLIAFVDEHEKISYTAILGVVAAVVAALSNDDIMLKLPAVLQHVLLILGPIVAAFAPKMLGNRAFKS